MSELEQRLNALMSNPQLMQQIASMAQTMGATSQQEQAVQNTPPAPSGASAPSASFDPKLLQTVAQVMGNAGVDENQEALLQALSPFLSGYRIQKLQRAMQAARLAGAASSFLNAGGLQMLTGRGN